MDDVEGKIAFMRGLQEKGISGDALQQALHEYDLMDEEQQAQARSALAQLHMQGTVPVPAQDQQDNEKNIQAARKLEAGTYDPERDSHTPEGLRSQASQRQAELYASMGLPDPTSDVIEGIERRAQSKPEVARSGLIIKGSSSIKKASSTVLRPAKVRK